MFKLFKGGRDFIVVGLGNPGRQYEKTRHNAGFAAADFLAEKYKLGFKKRFDSEYAELEIGGKRGFVQKPLTFMNSSGTAVRRLAEYYRIPPKAVIVMHDDITLEPGAFKIKTGGSDGGHNGLSSIITELKTWDFTHIKLGIGAKANKEQPLYDYVLQPMPDADMRALLSVLPDVAAAVEMLVKGEDEAAKAKFNHKRNDEVK